MKWKPDLTPEEFQEVIAPTPEGYVRSTEQGLQDGAWFKDAKGEWYIRIPWRQYTPPGGVKVFGQLIKAHDTHLKVMRGISTHDLILDVGGYDGIWAWLFEATHKVVIDICCEALERWAAIHAGVVCQDAKDLSWLYADNSFDVVFLLDVVEHMEEESAFACIEAAEKIAKYQVIVATPDGYQPFDDWESIITKGSDVPCAENMVHKSGWGEQFWADRGYKVIMQPGLHSDLGLGDGLVAFLNKG